MSKDGIVYALFSYEESFDSESLLSIHENETDVFEAALLITKTNYYNLFISVHKNIEKKMKNRKRFSKHFFAVKKLYDKLCDQNTIDGINFNLKSLYQLFLEYYDDDRFFNEIFETMDKVVEDYQKLFSIETDGEYSVKPQLFRVKEFIIGQNKLIDQECESEIDNIINGAESML